MVRFYLVFFPKISCHPYTGHMSPRNDMSPRDDMSPRLRTNGVSGTRIHTSSCPYEQENEKSTRVDITFNDVFFLFFTLSTRNANSFGLMNRQLLFLRSYGVTNKVRLGSRGGGGPLPLPTRHPFPCVHACARYFNETLVPRTPHTLDVPRRSVRKTVLSLTGSTRIPG